MRFAVLLTMRYTLPGIWIGIALLFLLSAGQIMARDLGDRTCTVPGQCAQPYGGRGGRVFDPLDGSPVYQPAPAYRDSNIVGFPVKLGIAPREGLEPKGGNRHQTWCNKRYRSYSVADNTFQPVRGPRQRCLSPFD